MSWFLYLIECADDSVYTGITNDVAARFDQHASGKGARYTRSRKPRALLASFPLPDRSIASRVEYWVKRLTAAQKRELAAGIRTLASVLPAGMSIDGSVAADGLQAGRRGRKKVKDKDEGADIATQPTDTDKPARKTAKNGNDGKTSRSTKTRIAKPGPTAPAPAKAKAAPAGKRAKTGDVAEVKKTSSRSTGARLDKPATNAAPKRKAPATGGKPVAKEPAGNAATPARRGAPTRKTATEAAEAAAPVATARRAPSAKRATVTPGAGALPARTRTRKKPAPRATPRAKQNRAAS